MQSYSQSSHPRVAVELDADLIEWVDQLLDADPDRRPTPDAVALDRTRAIEEAIQLWCKQQANRRLQRLADRHHQRHNDDETGWLV